MRREEGKQPDGGREFHPVQETLGSARSSRAVSFLKDSREKQKLTSPFCKGNSPSDSTKQPDDCPVEHSDSLGTGRVTKTLAAQRLVFKHCFPDINGPS